jgi:hypothetical protein
MTAAAGGRQCARCAKVVHDLGQMSEEQARALLAARSPGERVCIRYECDADGAVRFGPLKRVVAATATTLALAACSGVMEAANEPPAAATTAATTKGDASTEVWMGDYEEPASPAPPDTPEPATPDPQPTAPR